MPPGVNLTANLESVLGGTAEAGFLRVTLCGYGPVLPCISGVCMLADAGIPLIVGPQVGSTAITVSLWGNDVITPSGTFYEISVLDENKNVIQSGLYQFDNSAGDVDLSTVPQMVEPTGLPIKAMSYKPCTGDVPGSVYVAPAQAQVIAAAYNGALLPRGEDLPTLSYTLAGSTITLNFITEEGDRIDALCIV